MRARRCAATEPKYLLARASTQPRGSENPSACQSQRTVFIMRCRDLISSSDFERTDTLSFAKKAAQAPSVQNRLVDQRRNLRQRIPRVKRTRRFPAGGQINADRVLGTPWHSVFTFPAGL